MIGLLIYFYKILVVLMWVYLYACNTCSMVLPNEGKKLIIKIKIKK